MKNIQLLITHDLIQKNLNKLNQLKGAKLNYALIKNIKMLDLEIEDLKKTIEPTESFKKHEEERITLCKTFCVKDDKNEPILKSGENNQKEFDIDLSNPEWIAAIDALKLKNVDILLARDEQIKTYNEILNLDSTVNFHMVKLNDIPDEIDFSLMHIIEFMIID